MFWECHLVTSTIEKLLDQPADTIELKAFLDESDLIQECLMQNARLIDYLVQPTVMNELIAHVTQCPKDLNFRYAHVVSELLSGDFQRIQEALLVNEQLDFFYSFLLGNDEPLNPILASYFSRILMSLMIRRPTELLNYFKSRTTFKADFLRHLDSTSITDMLFRFIADCAEQRAEAIQWYEEMNIVDDLIKRLTSSGSLDVQLNIVTLLSEFLRLAFDQHHDSQRDTSTPVPSSTTMDHLDQSDEDQSSEKTSLTNARHDQFTTLTLAEHILSKSNLEHLLDAMCQRTNVVANGCEFLLTLLDLLNRSLTLPIRIPLNTLSQDDLSFDNQDPFVRTYLTFLDVIPSRLPTLIGLLSNPSAPLIASSSSSPSQDSSQTLKYQFISEPLGTSLLVA